MSGMVQRNEARLQDDRTGFDLWLRSGLNDQFGLLEPLPADLLRLVDDLAPE